MSVLKPEITGKYSEKRKKTTTTENQKNRKYRNISSVGFSFYMKLARGLFAPLATGNKFISHACHATGNKSRNWEQVHILFWNRDRKQQRYL